MAEVAGEQSARVTVVVLDVEDADRSDDSFSSYMEVNEVDHNRSHSVDESTALIERSRSNDVDKNHLSEANLYRCQNWSLLMGYFNTGVALTFLKVPVYFYLLHEHDSSSAAMNTFRAVTTLPWCFKIFFGLLSDSTPVASRHRRPYFVFGWSLFVLVHLGVALFVEAPNIYVLCAAAFFSTTGCALADTVADAQLVEASGIFESFKVKGRMRIQAYLVRAFGMAAGSLMGSLLFSHEVWSLRLDLSQCFLVQALLPLVSVFPFAPFMYEAPFRRSGPPHSAGELLKVCWRWISIDAVWIPLLYLFFFNLCWIANPSWANFLYIGLGFTALEMGILASVGALVGALGILAYNQWCFHHGWKAVYLWITGLGLVFSGLQLLLLYGFTLGLPAVVFAVGDESMLMAAQTIAFIPMAIMFLPQIPAGAEATIYALITTWIQLGQETSVGIGTAMSCLLEIRNSRLRSGHNHGLIILTWVIVAAQTLPIFFLWCRCRNVYCLPNGVGEVRTQFNSERVCKFGAAAFVLLYVTGTAASITESVLYLAYGEC